MFRKLSDAIVWIIVGFTLTFSLFNAYYNFDRPQSPAERDLTCQLFSSM